MSIALWDGNTPVLGVVNRYHSNEMFEGMIGNGAFLNGEEIHTSSVKEMKDGVMATGFPLKRDYSSEGLSTFIRTVQQFKKTRMLGAAALMGAFVANGRTDAYTEDGIMLWDIAAASAIVSAAGGIVNNICKGGDMYKCELFANEFLYDNYCSMKIADM